MTSRTASSTTRQPPDENGSTTSEPRRVLRWIGGHELGTVLLIAAIAVSALVFVKVADEVAEGGEWSNVDRALLLALRTRTNLADPIGPRWLEEMARDASALGGTLVLTLLTLGVVGHLLLVKKRRAAAFVASSITGATVLAYAMKDIFARPRPDVVPHLSYVSSASFPSGHSMLSAAVYLTLGALVARFQKSYVLKAYALLCAVLVTLLVGVTRVYIGVHWPTDVLGGWAAGAAWAAFCWVVARALQRRGKVEPEPQPDTSRESVAVTDAR